MPQAYAIRVKAGALDDLKACRERLRARLGSRDVSSKLAGLSARDAGELTNELLALLDAVDAVVSRAKPAD